MATRRNRIVVKPNLKPAVSKAGPTQKAKPSQALTALEATTVKPPTLSAHQDKPVAAVGDGDKAKHEKALADGNKISGSEKNLKQKPASLLPKPADSDVAKQSGKATGKEKDDASDSAANCNDKPVSVLSSLLAKPKVSDGSALKEKPPIELDTGNDSQNSTEGVDLVGSASLPATDDIVSPEDSAAGKADKSQQKGEAHDHVDGRGSTKTADISSEGRELTEEETPQPKQPKRKKEKKERKEPLPRNDQSPDRHKMKMSDLIVWNPSQNYFPKKKKTSASVKKEERPLKPESTPLSVDDESSSQSSSLPAPQVMIGPDGSIIVNTQSLIIETAKEDSEAKVIIEEDDDDKYLNSNSYRKTAKPKMWTENENEKFFMGLSMCGTDFSLMCKLLPKRSRRELKNKFRREEKRNRPLIDKALASRQPYDVAPFERMAAEESARLKEAVEVKKELKRKCKQEAEEQKQKKMKIKKERGRSRKRKVQESEDEEDDWDEPEYDDEGDESLLEEEDDNDVEISDSVPVTQAKRKNGKEKKMAAPAVGTKKGNPTFPNLPVFAIQENINRPFVPQSMSAQDGSSYGDVTIVTGVVSENSALMEHSGGEASRSSASSVHPQQAISRHLPASSVIRQATPSRNAGNQLTTGLRSIPGSAPIQIEMEGVTTPMQGVLIPSHMVPKLAPQLGIPPSSTPMQVLLVQEEGASGNLVHVYVVPEKESAPFAQTGHGRVATNESGQGLTLTSPIHSPHPPPRRPSAPSTPASPFSPIHPGPANSPFSCRSPHASSSHQSDETSMSTIRNVYGTAMNSLTSSSSGKEISHPSTVNSQTVAGTSQTNTTQFTVIGTQPPANIQLSSSRANVPQHTINNQHATIIEPPSFTNANHLQPPCNSTVSSSYNPCNNDTLSIDSSHSSTTPVTLIQTSAVKTHSNSLQNIQQQISAATVAMNVENDSTISYSQQTILTLDPSSSTSTETVQEEMLVPTEKGESNEDDDCIIVNSNNPQSRVEQVR